MACHGIVRVLCDFGSGREKGQWRVCPGIRSGSVATPLATGREDGGGGGLAAAFWGSQCPRDNRVGEQQWVCCGIVRMAFLSCRLWGGGGGGRRGRDVWVLHALSGVGILGGACQVDGAAKQ